MKILRAAFLAIVPGLFVACSSTPTKVDDGKLDRKLENEGEMQTRKDVGNEADYLIRTSPNLSEVQKASLLALRDNVRKELDSFQAESIKLRAVLLRDVLAANYDAKEVAEIKARMKRTEEKKLGAIFAAIEQANKIIGRGKLNAGDRTFDEFFIFDTMRIVP